MPDPTLFALQGTPTQVRLVQGALERSDFPWELLRPKLLAEKGRSQIPVEWADLSRYATALAEQRAKGGHGHVHDAGDTGDPIEFRERVLGLAWYSGRVTLDVGLEDEPELAQEVFLAEAAHMADFFFMTDEHRHAIFDLVHGLDPADPGRDTPEHGHDWFDVGTYGEWVGEAWMSVFCLAYSDVAPTILLEHSASREQARRLRPILTPGIDEPTGDFVHRTRRGKRYHATTHRLRNAYLVSREDAVNAGLSPCRRCLKE